MEKESWKMRKYKGKLYSVREMECKKRECFIPFSGNGQNICRLYEMGQCPEKYREANKSKISRKDNIMEQTPEIKEVNALALSVPEQAKQITIKTMADYTRASDIIMSIKAIRKKITDTFKPIKQKMDAAKQEVLDQEKAADAPLKEAEAWLSPQIIEWNREQERIRKAEEDRLRAIAQKEEEERQLAAAVAAEQSGNKEEAEAIIETPVQAAPVIVPKAVPKVAGMSIRENWKFRIIDEKKIPREYLKVDEVKIGQVVRAMKSAANIPGVEVYNEGTVSGRRAA
jgi:galactitol-specific phosphotransferase system IIB component